MNGKRLKEIRELRGLTQEDLIKLARVSQRTLTRYENSIEDSDSDSLARIAKTLNVSLDYLMGITDDPSPDNQLSDEERAVISALRRGERMEAIKAIAGMKG